ncbi:MAG: hypothetical protein NZ522_05910, partial [Chitinophagales bacterium]|nr:hypothetical protein [Chitinophagales bacterium]
MKTRTFYLIGTTLLSILLISKSFGQKQIVYNENSALALQTQEIKQKIKGVIAPPSKLYPENFEREDIFLKQFNANGPYSYADPSAELLDKRDENSKHFLTKDGKIISVIGAGPVHYYKNGLWHTTLNDIIPDQTIPGYSFANKFNRFHTFYGNDFKNGIFVKTENNLEIRFLQDPKLVCLDKNFNELKTLDNLTGKPSLKSDNEIIYQQVAKDIHAEIEHNAGGFKLSYEITSIKEWDIPAQASFIAFKERVVVPEGFTFSYQEEKGFVSVSNSTGFELFRYKAPVYFEKDRPYRNEGRIKGSYKIEQNGEEITIYILVPTEWLTRQDMQYPLIIDPITTVTPNATTYWTGTVEEDAGCDFSTNNDSDENIRVGFDDGTFDNDQYQGYAKFNVTSIPDDDCVLNATTRFFQYNFQNPRNDDNALRFWYQANDPITFDPVPATCDDIFNNINGFAIVYARYDVWGTCGGACIDYNESPNNVWKDFPQNAAARVKASL